MDLLVITGPIVPADIPGLCDRARALLATGRLDMVLCDVSALDPDAVVVDALAQLQLVAKRLGGEVRLLHAPNDLQDLLVLVGLRDALPLCEDLGVESGRKPEKREDPLGVEEETDPGDPIP